MTIELDEYVVETLLPDLVGHDRRPSAFLVYLFLWRTTRGGRDGASLSLRAIAEGTGLSKRAVQTALVTLRRRRLATARRGGVTDVPEYTLHRPWARGR